MVVKQWGCIFLQRLKSNYTIYPVVELNALHLNDKYKFKQKFSLNFTEAERTKFNNKIFKKAGFKKTLQMDAYAYYSIPISELSDDKDLLTFILHSLPKRKKKKNFDLEKIPALIGGIVIEFDDNTAIAPQCCGEIYNYQHWKEVLDKQPQEWTEIWIGHPWIYARVQNNTLELSEIMEATLSPQQDRAIKYTFDLNTFIQKLNLCIQEIKAFKKRIYKTLKKHQYPYPRKIANLLIDNTL